MIQQVSPSADLLILTQNKDHTIPISIQGSDGVALDLGGGGATADFTLYEDSGGPVLDYLTSAGGRINLLDGSGDGTNVELLWTEAQSGAILADSRRHGDVALTGHLRIIVSGLPTVTKRLLFQLIQTQVGS